MIGSISAAVGRSGARRVAWVALGVLMVAGRQAVSQETLNDGPHVYWLGEGHAIVFHLCEDELVRREVWAEDTLAFQGLCDDGAVTYRMSVTGYEAAPDVIDGAARILAVSDIHGEYEALVELLLAVGIVDADLDWAWGDGQLVVDGDIFDRGDRVTECLWLIHRLEQQAAAAGGRVHYVLGNHEVMVMQGDLRYVNDKYTQGIVRASDVEYEDLFGPEMELGRWLRSKNAVLLINGILFVHGGVSPALLRSELDPPAVNAALRRAIDVRSYEIAFDSTLSFLLGSEGPLWYRGYHRAMEDRYPRAEDDQIQSLLDRYGATAVVVGHTEIPEISGLYDQRVYGIDVPVGELGGLQGLLWIDGIFFRVDRKGKRTRL